MLRLGDCASIVSSTKLNAKDNSLANYTISKPKAQTLLISER